LPRTLADGPSQFGIFIPPFHKMDISPTVLYELDLELIERADRLGLQEAWVGEHHSGGHEPIGSPELFLAAAAQRTKNIMLGTAVNSLPYHNPLTLASRLTLLDHLSHGRAMMGFGPGMLASDAHMFDLDTTKQRDMMLEAAEVIVRLMSGEVVTHKSDWFSLQDAHLQVLPYQLPSLEMVVAAVASPSGPRTAGRLGLGMINLSATSPEAFEALNEHWSIVEAESERSGKTTTRDRWRLAAITHIAETEEQAREDCKFGFEQIWRYLGDVSPLPVSRATNLDDLIDEAIDAGYVVLGTPDDLIKVIRKLAAQTGGFGTFIMTVTDFADFDARLKAVELFARHVVPEFRGQFDSMRHSHEWVLGQHDEEATIWKTRTLDAIAKASEAYEAERGATPAGG
jgi:limonene 1,2-monooxygenase